MSANDNKLKTIIKQALNEILIDAGVLEAIIKEVSDYTVGQMKEELENFKKDLLAEGLSRPQGFAPRQEAQADSSNLDIDFDLGAYKNFLMSESSGVQQAQQQYQPPLSPQALAKKVSGVLGMNPFEGINSQDASAKMSGMISQPSFPSMGGGMPMSVPSGRSLADMVSFDAPDQIPANIIKGINFNLDERQ
jgi:hypothetical protein